jgi:hypothetical protein
MHRLVTALRDRDSNPDGVTDLPGGIDRVRKRMGDWRLSGLPGHGRTEEERCDVERLRRNAVVQLVKNLG